MSRVHLAVYDLSRGMAIAMSRSILGQQIDGIWHTGIVVFNQEYYFGGGIQVTPTGAFTAQNGLQPVQMQDMGITSKTQAELEAYLRTINHLFTQATYDLINNNCNNFADTVCQFLTGHGIPNHIVDLPRIVFSTPGGAMLRPMIEGMQNNIRQNGAGMDPFGGAAPPQSQTTGAHHHHPTPTLQNFETELSNQITEAVLNLPPLAITKAKAELEEKPLVSGDASTVRIIANKMLNLTVGDEKVPALTADEKTVLLGVVEQLATASSSGPVSFPSVAYGLIERVLDAHSSCHMSALFLLRLMLLQHTAIDLAPDSAEWRLLSNLLRRLETYSSEAPTLSSVPAYAMGVCALSNLLSHSNGAQYLLFGTHLSSAGSSTNNGEAVVDIILSGLAHSRAEIRQMSVTLAYNFTLANTIGGTLSGLWAANGNSIAELHPSAVQLLCCCLEGVLSEQDTTVRKRRLAVVCRIFRAYGAMASDFVMDLGFSDLLEILRCHTTDGETKKLTADEAAIVNELVAAYH